MANNSSSKYKRARIGPTCLNGSIRRSHLLGEVGGPRTEPEVLIDRDQRLRKNFVRAAGYIFIFLPYNFYILPIFFFFFGFAPKPPLKSVTGWTIGYRDSLTSNHSSRKLLRIQKK